MGKIIQSLPALLLLLAFCFGIVSICFIQTDIGKFGVLAAFFLVWAIGIQYLIEKAKE